MTIGILIFVVGIFIYAKSDESGEPVKYTKDLNEVIEMAIADGVLSNNERNVIKRLTEENGLDYDSIIKDAENQISNFEIDTAETEIVDFKKKNGHDFEKYIAQKFDKKYFKLKNPHC